VQRQQVAQGNPSVMGAEWAIRQEYFQSFIKRIVEILWAIFAIPMRNVPQGLTGRGDCSKRFPL
jgi:hypothetical protein